MNKTIKQKNKKIISFSLWGKIRLYNIGAIKNALLAKKYFPDWICRFYYDTSIPSEIINYLKDLDNVELVYIDIPSGGEKYKEDGQFGMLWRYYPLNDDNVDIWLARDIDSRISPYEKKKIDQFINSSNIIHCFRHKDGPNIRGGLFSFKNYSNNNNIKIDNRIINNKKLDIYNLFLYINQYNTKFYTDENFLKDKIYPLYKTKYSWDYRLFDNKLSSYFGRYVGDVIDEYDNNINKNTTSDFNNHTKYDDLNEIIKKYIDLINKD